LNVKVCDRKEKSLVSMTVVVTADEFNAEIEAVFRQNRGRITVPGFRKGKAPRKIIERMYGADIFRDDAIESVSSRAYAFGLDESGMSAVDYPTLAKTETAEDGSVELTFEFPVYPEVKLGSYKGVSAVRQEPTVPESAVDSEIAGLRLRNARLETAERPAIGGDSAYIDYEGFLDGEPFEGGKGENFELVLGSGTFIPGFEQQVQGMRVGEEKDINVRFPDDYKAENLSGKDAVFKVKLRDLKEKILPDLDDEFAKDVSEFDTLEEYKQSIREKLASARLSEVDNQFETAVLDEIAKELECDVPEAMIEQYVDMSVNDYSSQIAQYGMELSMYLNMTGTTIEQLRENMRPNAERQTRYSLILDKVAKLEGFEVSDEEVEAEYAERAEKYMAEVDDVKAESSAEAVKSQLLARKALRFVVDNAVALPPPPPEETPADAEATDAAEGTKGKKTTKSARSAGSKKGAKDAADTADAGDGDAETPATAKPKTTRRPRAAKTDDKSATAEADTADGDKPAKTAKTTKSSKTAAKPDADAATGDADTAAPAKKTPARKPRATKPKPAPEADKSSEE
jgi:trigger factor